MEKVLEAILTSLANSGVVGCVLAFVMWRLDKRMEALEAAKIALRDEFWRGHREVADGLDRMNTAGILRWISSPEVHPSVKEAATELIEQNRSATDARKK